MSSETFGEMRQLEEAVNKSEGDGLRARWESGRCMVTMRQGKKRLPDGALVELAEELQVHKSELTARMKFADKYPTENELTTAMSKFGSWYEIRKNGLTTTLRVKNHETGGRHDDHGDHQETDGDNETVQSCSLKLRGVLKVLEGLDPDPETLTKADLGLLAKIENQARRLREGFEFLNRKEAA